MSKSSSQHVDVPQRAYDNLHKRPPPGIHNSVADVVKRWVSEGCDDTLKVNSLGHTRRKVWMGERGMKFNFNKRKQTLDVVDSQVTDCKCRMQIALEIDEQRKISNMTVTQWWKHEQINRRIANDKQIIYI